MPRHAQRKALIVGAIDDDALRMRVLSEIADASIILDCMAGHCGPSARMWAEHRSIEVIQRVREELDDFLLKLVKKVSWAFGLSHQALSRGAHKIKQ